MLRPGATKGKAIFILQRTHPLEILKFEGNLLKGTNAKTRGNKGQGYFCFAKGTSIGNT